MKTITTTTTTGKKITFKVNGEYYRPENFSSHISDIFEEFKNMRYCVLYTKIVHDRGYREISSFGSPSLENYDNGLVGYQNGQFFKDEAEAKDDYAKRQKLTGYDCDYADVFLVENKSRKIS